MRQVEIRLGEKAIVTRLRTYYHYLNKISDTFRAWTSAHPEGMRTWWWRHGQQMPPTLQHVALLSLGSAAIGSSMVLWLWDLRPNSCFRLRVVGYQAKSPSRKRQVKSKLVWLIWTVSEKSVESCRTVPALSQRKIWTFNYLHSKELAFMRILIWSYPLVRWRCLCIRLAICKCSWQSTVHWNTKS